MMVDIGGCYERCWRYGLFLRVRRGGGDARVVAGLQRNPGGQTKITKQPDRRDRRPEVADARGTGKTVGIGGTLQSLSGRPAGGTTDESLGGADIRRCHPRRP